MTTAKTFSIDDLNVRKAQAEAFEMPYIDPEGKPTGVVILVLGAHSDSATAASAKLMNERRKREAVLARSKPGAVEYTKLEDDIEFTQKTAASRISGWTGITQDYSADLALQLCENNPILAKQVLDASNDDGNFTKPSSRK